VTYMKERRPGEAESALLKAIELRPNYSEAYNTLGALYDGQKLYSKSEPAFLRALLLNPRKTNALFNLGVSYNRQSRFAESLARFDDLVKIDPHYTDAYLQRGVALLQLKRNREATTSLLSYLSSRPDDAFARIKLGEAFYGVGKYEAAIEAFTQAGNVPGPLASAAWSQLGFTYYNLLKYAEAFAALKKALLINPGNLDAILYTGIVYLDQGEKQQARSYFEEVLALSPAHPEAQYYMGYIYFKDKEFVKARELFLAVIRQKPDHVKARYQLAQTYFRLNQPGRGQEALAIYTKLQELERNQRKDSYKVSKAALPSISAPE